LISRTWEGEKRVIISFRATGRPYLINRFRRGILDINNDLHVMKIGNNIDKAEIVHKKSYNKNDL
jgi:hypothetical protein